MNKLNKIKLKVEEWKNINKELEKLDSPQSKQVFAVNREHIKDLEYILNSNCCNSPLIDEADICGNCGEHCEVSDE